MTLHPHKYRVDEVDEDVEDVAQSPNSRMDTRKTWTPHHFVPDFVTTPETTSSARPTTTRRGQPKPGINTGKPPRRHLVAHLPFPRLTSSVVVPRKGTTRSADEVDLVTRTGTNDACRTNMIDHTRKPICYTYVAEPIHHVSALDEKRGRKPPIFCSGGRVVTGFRLANGLRANPDLVFRVCSCGIRRAQNGAPDSASGVRQDASPSELDLAAWARAQDSDTDVTGQGRTGAPQRSADQDARPARPTVGPLPVRVRVARPRAGDARGEHRGMLSPAPQIPRIANRGVRSRFFARGEIAGVVA